MDVVRQLAEVDAWNQACAGAQAHLLRLRHDGWPSQGWLKDVPVNVGRRPLESLDRSRGEFTAVAAGEKSQDSGTSLPGCPCRHSDPDKRSPPRHQEVDGADGAVGT